MRDLVLKGTPRELDAFLRPVLRGLQVLVVAPTTLALLWLQWWWWLPVPLIVSVLATEWFFWSRGDRACVLTLGAGSVRVADPRMQRDLEIPLGTIRSASLLVRDAPDAPEEREVVVALGGPEGPLLAVAFRVQPGAVPDVPFAVDVDAADAVLGGIAGVVRSLAPRERVFRQVIRDDAGLQHLVASLPPEIWQRAAVRCWRGAEPSLDLFGYHDQPADHALLLDPDAARLTAGGSPSSERALGPDHPVAVGRSARQATLFTMHGEDHAELDERLPLMIVDLHPLGRIAFPAPSVDPSLPEVALDDDLLHVHGPEGAVILWHLARCGVLPDLPAAIRAVLPAPSTVAGPSVAPPEPSPG